MAVKSKQFESGPFERVEIPREVTKAKEVSVEEAPDEVTVQPFPEGHTVDWKGLKAKMPTKKEALPAAKATLRFLAESGLLAATTGASTFAKMTEGMPKQKNPMANYESLFERGIDKQAASPRHDLVEEAFSRPMVPRHQAPDRFSEGMEKSLKQIEERSNGSSVDIFGYIDRQQKQYEARQREQPQQPDLFEQAMRDFEQRQAQYNDKRNGYTRFKRER